MVLALKNKHALKHLLQAIQLAKSVFYYQVKVSKKANAYKHELALIKVEQEPQHPMYLSEILMPQNQTKSGQPMLLSLRLRNRGFIYHLL